MASNRPRSRVSHEIPLLIQRITPRLEPHQLQGRIILTSGVTYEIGLDASVDERGGRAGFAAVVLWPGLEEELLVFAQAWNDGPLSVGYCEGLALLLLLSWLQETCEASDHDLVRLHIYTDRLDMVEGLASGTGEGRWSRHLHNRILRTVRELLMERQMDVQLQWRSRSTRLITLADAHANTARSEAPSTGTTLSESVVRHLRLASGLYRRRPAQRR